MATLNDYGITSGETNLNLNDIFADDYNPTKIDMLNVLGTNDFVLKRGALLKHDGEQEYSPIIDKDEILDDDIPIAAVALKEIKLAATGVKVAAIVEGNFIQQRLTPSDVPAGIYNSGNIIIRKEQTI